MDQDHCEISETARRAMKGFQFARWAREQRWNKLIPWTARRIAGKSHISRSSGMSR